MFHPSRRRAALAVTLALVAAMSASAALAQYKPDPSAPRAEIPKAYQWSATHIFPDDAAWEAELAAIADDIKRLEGALQSAFSAIPAHDRVLIALRFDPSAGLRRRVSRRSPRSNPTQRTAAERPSTRRLECVGAVRLRSIAPQP